MSWVWAGETTRSTKTGTSAASCIPVDNCAKAAAADGRRPGPSEQALDAKHERAWRGEREPVAEQLGCGIHATRIRAVLLRVWTLRLSVEHEVRAVVDENRPCPRRRGGNRLDGECIDTQRGHRIVLRAVDVVVGSAVDHNVSPRIRYGGLNRSVVGDVQRRVIQCDDIFPRELAADRGPQQPPAARDQEPHHLLRLEIEERDHFLRIYFEMISGAPQTAKSLRASGASGPRCPAC